MKISKAALLLAPIFVFATPALASMPQSVSAMLDEAMTSGSEAEVDAVAKFAKKANPDSAADIDAKVAGYKAKLAADAAAKAKADADAKAQAGFFDNWKGEGQLGAFLTTGNSDTSGVSAGLALTKEGVRWRYNFKALADYQKSNGLTSREQFLTAFEPNYKFNDRLFAYGLGQYERDKFQGFSSRYTLSGGLGYRAIADENMTLDVKAGPAWRKTNFIGIPDQSSLAALGAANLAWKLAPNISFTEGATIYIESGNSTLTSLSAFDLKLAGSLSARLSYQVNHETSPPPGLDKTDTISRVTVVYGF